MRPVSQAPDPHKEQETALPFNASVKNAMVPRQLIIDDNEELAENIREVLELEFDDVEVDLAPTGERALELVAEHQYDLVITDMRMPGIGGAEVVKKIQELRPGTPILVMTAYAEDGLLNDAQDSGAFGVVLKPIDLGRLVETIERVYRADAKILLVDDDRDLRANLLEAVQTCMEGTVAVPAANLAAARRVMAQVEFKGAIVDMRLPDGRGHELVNELREAGLPVIVISGYAEELEDSKLEADRVLSKPFDTQALIDAVGETVKAS